MKKLIKSLDFNGVQPQLSFFNNDLKFKTIQGGIISIITYIIGFAYFFYLMTMWITYQIPPAVTNQLEFYQELRQFKLVQPLFVFVLDINPILQQIHDYDVQENGEIYKLYIQTTQQQEELTNNPPKFDCEKQADTSDYFDPICINLNDQFQTNLGQNYQNRTQDTNNQLYVEFCDPAQDDKCLSHEQQNYIFDTLYSRWRLTLITQDVNLQTGAITNIPQDLYFATSKQTAIETLNFDLLIQKATYIIDDGIIFPNLRQIEIVRSINLQTTISFLDDIDTSIISRISYSLDRKEEVIRVVHPKLGLIVAELGYSLQLLLFLGSIMNKYNAASMNAMVNDALLKIYFPDFKLFEFRLDWKGKIKSIYNKREGHILNKSDEAYMLKLRETLSQQVRSKLNYINILYEMSRIQLLLQMTIPRQQILLTQDLGYKVKLPDKYVVIKQIDGQADESEYDYFLDQEQYEDFQRKIPQQEKQAYKKQYTFGDSLSPVPSPLSEKSSINLFAQLQQKITHSIVENQSRGKIMISHNSNIQQ